MLAQLLLAAAVTLVATFAHGQDVPLPESTQTNVASGPVEGVATIEYVAGGNAFKLEFPHAVLLGNIDILTADLTSFCKNISSEQPDGFADVCIRDLLLDVNKKRAEVSVNMPTPPPAFQTSIYLNEKVINVTLPDLNLHSIFAAAESVCAEHGPDLGISADALRPGCIDPVAAHIHSSAKEFLSKQKQVAETNEAGVSDTDSDSIVRIKFPIFYKDTDGNDQKSSIEVKYDPLTENADDVALAVCLKEGSRIGLPPGLNRAQIDSVCANPMAALLRENADKALAVKTAAAKGFDTSDDDESRPPIPQKFELQLNVNGESFSVILESLQPDDIVAASTRLCHENATFFKVTESNLNQSCIKPLANYMYSSIHKTYKEALEDGIEQARTPSPLLFDDGKIEIGITLYQESADKSSDEEVSETIYVSYDPRIHTPEVVAKSFCRKNGALFQLTPESEEEQVLARCVTPMVDVIKEKLQERLLAQSNIKSEDGSDAPSKPEAWMNAALEELSSLQFTDEDLAEIYPLLDKALLSHIKGSLAKVNPRTGKLFSTQDIVGELRQVKRMLSGIAAADNRGGK